MLLGICAIALVGGHISRTWFLFVRSSRTQPRATARRITRASHAQRLPHLLMLPSLIAAVAYKADGMVRR